METALRVRNILLRGFVINYVLIFVVWLVMLTGLYHVIMDWFFGMHPHHITWFIVHLLGWWKVLGAVFFLVPALAIQWELKCGCCSKEDKPKARRRK